MPTLLDQLELVLQLLQQTCVFLVIAWLLAQTPLAAPLLQLQPGWRRLWACAAVFTGFCLLGTWLGLPVNDSLANIRAIGAVLGGWLGGPVVGLGVGLAGGLHRYSLGGPTALACMVATAITGLLAGLAHALLRAQGREAWLWRPMLVGLAAMLAEALQMGLILLLTQPRDTAWAVVRAVAAPMLLANSLGAAAFMRMLLDRQAMAERLRQAVAVRAQQQLLAQAEIRLLHAQVNPHFLFNALNTLAAVIRQNPPRARELVQHLADWFRSNLKRPQEDATLQEEFAHVRAYLEIEQARFGQRLQLELALPEALSHVRLPAFSLQPLVENAIKHGCSQRLEDGVLRLWADAEGAWVRVHVQDNAGLYRAPAPGHEGLGLSLVHKRLQARFGNTAGLSVRCEPLQHTCVTLTLPLP
ncbi:LytS/YhcK type 5TM receptor domain-containing protein [Roseateles sp. BYS180W]|uniref:LytS/YhcK type 5TM receptor domain-containing protein n=1 Tax=Roseateles rivi TaxID=3299028 RepID=A0ABW7FTF2_9BURK